MASNNAKNAPSSSSADIARKRNRRLARDDVGGLAVHLGARVGALAHGGEVLASQTVRDLAVGSGIEWDDRGSHVLKGVPGEWRVYAVKSE